MTEKREKKKIGGVGVNIQLGLKKIQCKWKMEGKLGKTFHQIGYTDGK